jgi:hypothetical protein
MSVRKTKKNYFKVVFYSFLGMLLFISCLPEKKGNSERFKIGVFETPATGDISKAVIIRTDSIQIEQYTKKVMISTGNSVVEELEKHVDTFSIRWKNNFAYTLINKNPKTDLEKDPIFVQITNVKKESYDFTLRFGYSKFKQTGTVYKIK